jgi:mannose-6-phosphate isomerase-like protein (cupin superfamily)
MTYAVDVCAQRGVGAVLDEFMVGEVAEPDAAAVRERAVRCDGELQRLGRDCRGQHPFALQSEWRVNDREIDLTVRGASHELGSAGVMKPQRHGRMRTVKAGKQRGEVDFYAEVFVVHAGEARFEIDELRLSATAGDIVIAPARSAHRFTNASESQLRLTGIHTAPDMDTEWLESTTDPRSTTC